MSDIKFSAPESPDSFPPINSLELHVIGVRNDGIVFAMRPTVVGLKVVGEAKKLRVTAEFDIPKSLIP